MPKQEEVTHRRNRYQCWRCIFWTTSGVVFQEVTIDRDYQTQPVVDGEEIHLAPWTFNTQLQE